MRTVLITGASGGIGAEIARRFAGEGYAVGIHCNSSVEKAKELAEELNRRFGADACVFQCDIRDSLAVDTMVEAFMTRYGHMDALVCSCGIAHIGLFTEMTDSEWSDVIDTNLSGTFYACRAAARHMIRRGAGAIVTVSSMWGQVGASCEAAYSASKAGVIGLTEAVAKELGPSGVRVNCVAPGMIDTPMNKDISAETARQIAEETPLCRTGTPRDVAGACLFLASDDASFITGQVLGISGGLVI